MSGMPVSDEQRDAIALRLAMIARDAGQALRKFTGPLCRKTNKADGSPVTEADMASEAIILAGLAGAFPEWPVVSEEQTDDAPCRGAPVFFLVDPLDGTRAFVGGGADYCILIALVADAVPIASAIHAPASGKTWWAGARAFTSDTPDLLPVRRLDSLPPRTGGSVAIVSSVHAGEASRGLCKQLGIAEVRCENSALKFARLAEGEADIYPRVGRTMQWDVAAGDALLRAIGGGVFGLDGRPLVYGAGNDGWYNPDFIALRTPPAFAAIP